jgi:hypothetical protein
MFYSATTNHCNTNNPRKTKHLFTSLGEDITSEKVGLSCVGLGCYVRDEHAQIINSGIINI